ncbi:unnamed protein product, partial [Linum tenue]
RPRYESDSYTTPQKDQFVRKGLFSDDSDEDESKSPFEKHGVMKVEGLEGFTKNLQNPVEDLYYVVTKEKVGDKNWDNLMIVD